MSKRTSDAADLPHAKLAATGAGQMLPPRVPDVDEGMGEFEDRWEDDIESEDEAEEVVVDAAEHEEEEGEDGDVGEFSGLI
jgi:ribosome assembly protein RRB1